MKCNVCGNDIKKMGLIILRNSFNVCAECENKYKDYIEGNIDICSFVMPYTEKNMREALKEKIQESFNDSNKIETDIKAIDEMPYEEKTPKLSPEMKKSLEKYKLFSEWLILIGVIVTIVMIFVLANSFSKGEAATSRAGMFLFLSIIVIIAGVVINVLAKKKDAKKLKRAYIGFLSAIVLIPALYLGSFVIKQRNYTQDADEQQLEYWNKMIDLCNEYGLNDCIVKCGVPEKYSEDGAYSVTVVIDSDKYMDLSKEDAFQFCYDAECLGTEGEASLLYSVTIESRGHTFDFDTEKQDIDNTEFGYVMMDYGGSVITGRRSIFSVSDYDVIWSDTNYFK